MANFTKFDGLEISPVCFVDSDKIVCETCDAVNADFWSVYGHLSTGGVECIADFYNDTEALKLASRLLTTYPHLSKYGLQRN